MLVAECPRCGAPSGVSVAEPERLSCASCHYVGAPRAEVTARLREAQGALAQEDARGRQLTDLQRRAVTMGPRAERSFLGVVALFEVPFLFMIVSQVARGLAGAGDEARRALVGGCAYVPTVAILAVLGAVAFFQIRRMREGLEAACAAVPPGAPGEPCRCHLCGGPVAPAGVEAIARCSYCQADNVVSARVLEAQGQARTRQVQEYAGEVRARAAAVARAGKSRAFAFAAAVPLFTCLCGCPNIFLAYQLGLARPTTADCEHVLLPSAEGLCVGERRGDLLLLDGAPSAGPAAPLPSAARGMPRVTERGTGRGGQVVGSLARARVCGGQTQVRWDDGTRSEAPAARLCFPSP